MHLSDFHYELPDSLIAQRPCPERTASRLLYLPAQGQPTDRQFVDFGELVNPGDVLVFNDTQVIPARLHGRKETGGAVEILLERVIGDDIALAMIRASKSPKPGGHIFVGDAELRCEGRDADLFRLRAIGISLAELMQRHGHMPLPPYIQREDDQLDADRYQTVYAQRPGAVAAPTAGLHFDDDLLNRLRERGVGMARVTLHVGAGTFHPVREQQVERHRMHSEWLEVDEEAVDAIADAQRRGGRVIAIGTTAVRSLETAAADGTLRPYRGETHLFIRPGYQFRSVDALLTNFHLPESTLLMLVCAFAGHERTLAAYQHAVAARYRFFSYGDAMFVEPGLERGA